MQKLHKSVWPALRNSELPTLMPVANGLDKQKKPIWHSPCSNATMTSSQNVWGTAEHYPLTNDQLRDVQRDVLEMNTRADELAQLLAAAFGEADERTIRAKEIDAAFQRLQWAIQRSSGAKAT